MMETCISQRQNSDNLLATIDNDPVSIASRERQFLANLDLAKLQITKDNELEMTFQRRKEKSSFLPLAP